MIVLTKPNPLLFTKEHTSSNPTQKFRRLDSTKHPNKRPQQNNKFCEPTKLPTKQSYTVSYGRRNRLVTVAPSSKRGKPGFKKLAKSLNEFEIEKKSDRVYKQLFELNKEIDDSMGGFKNLKNYEEFEKIILRKSKRKFVEEISEKNCQNRKNIERRTKRISEEFTTFDGLEDQTNRIREFKTKSNSKIFRE
jgi:hypothetical protein